MVLVPGLGVIRDIAVEQDRRTAHALVDFNQVFGREPKTAAVPLDTLTPSIAKGTGYVVAITAVAYHQLPAYTSATAPGGAGADQPTTPQAIRAPSAAWTTMLRYQS